MDVRLPDGTVVKNVPPGTTQAELTARLAKARGTKLAPLTTMGPLDQAIQESRPEPEADPAYQRHPLKSLEHSMRAADVPFRAMGNAVMDWTGSPALATLGYIGPQAVQPGAAVKLGEKVAGKKLLKRAGATFDDVLKRRLAEEGKTGWREPAPISAEQVEEVAKAIETPKFPSKTVKTPEQKAGGKQKSMATPQEITGDPHADNLDVVLPIREGPRVGAMPDLPTQEFPKTKLPEQPGGPTEPKPIGTKPVKPSRDEQGGKINPALATKLASTATGALVGAGLDPNDPIQGAIYGAAGGFLVGHSVSRRVMSGGFGSAMRAATNEGAALHNAKEAELASAQRGASQTFEAIKAFKIPEDRGMMVMRAMETGDFSALSPQEKAAAQLFLTETGKLGLAAQETGVIPRLKRNYVPLVFDWSDKKTAETLRRMGHEDTTDAERVSGFSTFTPFQLERTIPDYATAERLGLKPKTTSLHELFGLYANSVIRATENKRALIELQNLKMADGRPLVSAGNAPKDWVPINKGDTRVPELDGFFVHPDIAESVRAGFKSYDPDVIARAALNTSWFAKRFNVSLSAFHPMALLQAYAGAGGNPLDVAVGALARGAEKLTGGKLSYESAIDKALSAYKKGGAGDQVDTLIRNGLKLDAPIEDRAGRDAFIKTMDLAEKKAGELGASPAGIPFKAAKAVDDKLQRFTWDYMYTGMKLNTGMRLLQREVERNMSAAASGKEPLKPINQIAEDVSSFVNSTFGGLNMRRIAETVESEWGKKAARTAASPRGQAYLQMAVFAPDWKLSTLQAWTRGLGLTGNADLQRLHREYLVRSSVMSMVLADAINYKLSGHHVWANDFHSKRGHQQTAMEQVHDATFVDLGDGRKMQMFKHLMEGPHAVSDPQKFALNAMGYVPRTVGTMLTNKQFMTPDWAPPIAENYLTPMQKAYRYGTWPLKQAMPITGQQFDAGWGPTVGGFLGLPIYGLTAEERQRLGQKRVEDRAKAMENR